MTIEMHPSLQVLCFVLAIGCCSAAASHGRPRHPCENYDNYRWVESELADALDDEATQALPSALVSYGWRRHQSGRCSYRGYHAPCPYQDDEPQSQHFWDTLFPEPQPVGGPCDANEGCCSRLCITNICRPPGTPVTCPASPGPDPANSAGWNCTNTQRAAAASDATVPQWTKCVAACPYGGTPWNATCGRDGTWSKTVGACNPQPTGPECAGLPTTTTPDNADGWACTGNTTGATCTANCTCATVGAAWTASCLSNGTWQVNKGGCCPAAPSTKPPNVQTWDCPCGNGHASTECTAYCSQSGGTPGTAVCNSAKEEWDIVSNGTCAACPATPDSHPPNAAAWSCPTVPQDGDVCTASCLYGGTPYNATCNGTSNSWQVSGGTCFPPPPSCFSAATKVTVKGAPGPVNMEDLRVGDQVLCLDGGPDLMTPGSAHWCEVKGFTRASPDYYKDMVRLNVTTQDGTKASITLSSPHIVNVLEGTPGHRAAATVTELGPYSTRHAVDVRPGQQLPLALSADPSARFSPAVVDSVEHLEARGRYTPSIEHPYLVADGLVLPLWTGFPSIQFTGVANPADRYRAMNALRQMVMSPYWMAKLQPHGTPARLARWDDGHDRPPLSRQLSKSWTTMLERGTGLPSGVVNMTKVEEWFALRYDAWLADRSKAVSEEEVVEMWPQFFVTAAAGAAAGIDVRPQHDPDFYRYAPPLSEVLGRHVHEGGVETV